MPANGNEATSILCGNVVGNAKNISGYVESTKVIQFNIFCKIIFESFLADWSNFIPN